MLALLKKIRDENQTEILRRQWLQYIPLMAMGFIRQQTFEEYKGKSIQSIDFRPKEDILAEVDAIRNELKGE